MSHPQRMTPLNWQKDESGEKAEANGFKYEAVILEESYERHGHPIKAAANIGKVGSFVLRGRPINKIEIAFYDVTDAKDFCQDHANAVQSAIDGPTQKETK